MASYGICYSKICTLQQSLEEHILNGSHLKDKASGIMAWIRAEQMKREMRGIPPLKAIDARELAQRKLKRIGSKAAARAIVDIETAPSPTPSNNLEPSKESLSTPKTVTAVTAPPDPNGQGGLM